MDTQKTTGVGKETPSGTTTARLVACVGCGSTKWKVSEVRDGYELAVCSECGLRFTTNPDYKPERYLAAYEGKQGGAILPAEYAHVYEGPQLRLAREGRAFLCPPPRLSPAERLALKWLKRSVPAGAKVVECGCGTGRFLRALRRAAITAVGVELSEITVTLLKKAGLRAVQGGAPDFPWEEPEPFAIAFFEVLEHLAEPANVIAPLKHRFPHAVILGSVPSPRGPGADAKAPTDSPPHHYLLWTPTALKRFFGRLGYSKVTVRAPDPVGYEYMASCGMVLSRFKRSNPASPSGQPCSGPKPFAAATPVSSSRLKATVELWLLAAYHLGVSIFGSRKARRARQQGLSAAAMLFIAEA